MGKKKKIIIEGKPEDKPVYNKGQSYMEITVVDEDEYDEYTIVEEYEYEYEEYEYEEIVEESPAANTNENKTHSHESENSPTDVQKFPMMGRQQSKAGGIGMEIYIPHLDDDEVTQLTMP